MEPTNGVSPDVVEIQLTKRQIAQRARREKEKIAKQTAAYGNKLEPDIVGKSIASSKRPRSDNGESNLHSVHMNRRQKAQCARRQKERLECNNNNASGYRSTLQNKNVGAKRKRDVITHNTSPKNSKKKDHNRNNFQSYTMDGITHNQNSRLCGNERGKQQITKVQQTVFWFGSSSTGNSARENEVIIPITRYGITLPRQVIIEATENEFQEYYNDLSEDTLADELEFQSDNKSPIAKERHYLGKMDVECQFCHALHWLDEKLVHSSRKNPRFGMCCLQGKIQLPLLSPLPPSIQNLYEGSDKLSKSFRANIRSYNASNAFTSLGVKMDDRIFQGRGPRSFTVDGELCHRVGSLLPEIGQEPSYAQLYIYDSNAALDYRNTRNPHLRKDVLKIIHETLVENNKLCKLYKHAYEILKESSTGKNSNIPVWLHYQKGTDKKRYNLPTSEDIAVILPGDGTEIPSKRDIVLHLTEIFVRFLLILRFIWNCFHSLYSV